MSFVRRLREIWLKEGHTSLHLAVLPWVRVESAASHAAPCWHGLVELEREAKLALNVPAGASVRYRVAVPPHAVLHGSVGLGSAMPAGSGVEFRLEIRNGNRNQLRTWTRRLDGTQSGSRAGWIGFTVPLAEFEGAEVDLDLSATGTGPAAAEAIPLWGEPSLRSRRHAREFVALARAYLALFGFGPGARKAIELLRRPSLDHATDYDAWLRRHRPSEEELDRQRREQTVAVRPRIALLLVARDGADHLGETIASIRRQTYANWQLCLADSGVGPALRAALEREAASEPRICLAAPCAPAIAWSAALERSDGEFVAPVGCGDELAPHALYAIAAAVVRQDGVNLVYSDEDRIAADGSRSHPFFKPDWSPEYFLSTGYTRRLSVFRRETVDRVGGFRPAFGAAQEFDLALRIAEQGGRIAHVDDVLYHVRSRADANGAGPLPAAADECQAAVREHFARTRIEATCEPHHQPGFLRIRQVVRDAPLISIVIPTAGRARLVGEKRIDLVLNCVRSIFERSSYTNFEILGVGGPNLGGETRAGLEAMRDARFRLFTSPRPLTLAGKMNWGAGQARGPQLVFLNDDIEVLSPDWLEALLEFSQHPDIGAVGAKLLFPSGCIQHGGMAVADRLPLILHRGYPRTHPGYFGNLLVPCNLSSLIGACLMTRTEIFARIGGFDEAMPFLWHDLDYCFKVRARNLRVVFSPYAELYHFETASKSSAFRALETVHMARVWADQLERDPFYNRNLRQDRADFRVVS